MRPAWQLNARCRIERHPVELFFPFREEGYDNRPQILEAKAVCARCRVRAECLEYGLESRHGVWGGTTLSERRRIRMERARQRRWAS